MIAAYAILGPILTIGIDITTNTLIQHVPYSNSAVEYWSHMPSVIGLDHGIKGLYLLFFGTVSYWLWRWTGKEDSPGAHIGLIAGVLYGLVLGMSLDLQGVAMSFAARAAALAPHMEPTYAVLGNWAMTGGGLSVSLYVVADLFFAAWLLSAGSLLRRAGFRWLGVTGAVFALAVAGASLADWTSLIVRGTDTATHLMQQNVEYLAQVWVAVVAIRWLFQRAKPVDERI